MPEIEVFDSKGMPPAAQVLDELHPDKVLLQALHAVLSQVTDVRAGSRDRSFDLVNGQLALVPGRDGERFADIFSAAAAFAAMGVAWVCARPTDDSRMIAILEDASYAVESRAASRATEENRS